MFNCLFVFFGAAQVDIQVPLYRDERTPEFSETSEASSLFRESGDVVDAPTIKMDAMAFGMGCCCLQVTFQVRYYDM